MAFGRIYFRQSKHMVPGKRIATWIFYLLAFYILLQTIWWGYSLMQLNHNVILLQHKTGGSVPLLNETKRRWMIIGEGAVFILLLAFGFWRLIRYVRQEFRMARMEKTFLLSVTHEIKTPISALRLLLETAAKRDMEKPQLNNIVMQALNETEKLQSLSDNVLMTTRLDHGNEGLSKEAVDLSDVIEQVAGERNRQPANTNRVLFQQNEPAWISGDRQLIRLMISNLIDNALKYSPAEAAVRIKLKQDGSQVKVSVEDGGPGIPVEERENVFGKFFRIPTDEVRTKPGTGLGLYLVRNIVKLHGGHVSIENNEPRGTRVNVVFP